VAPIPIPRGRSLRPVKDKGRGSVEKVVDQNFPSIFHWTNYTLNKTSPRYFSLPLSILTPIFQTTPLTKFPPIFTSPYFQSTSLTKLPHYFFYFCPSFQSTSLKKLSPQRGKKPKMKGKTWVRNWANLSQKLGGSYTWFRFQIWRIETTAPPLHQNVVLLLTEKTWRNVSMPLDVLFALRLVSNIVSVHWFTDLMHSRNIWKCHCVIVFYEKY